MMKSIFTPCGMSFGSLCKSNCWVMAGHTFCQSCFTHCNDRKKLRNFSTCRKKLSPSLKQFHVFNFLRYRILHVPACSWNESWMNFQTKSLWCDKKDQYKGYKLYELSSNAAYAFNITYSEISVPLFMRSIQCSQKGVLTKALRIYSHQEVRWCCNLSNEYGWRIVWADSFWSWQEQITSVCSATVASISEEFHETGHCFRCDVHFHLEAPSILQG